MNIVVVFAWRFATVAELRNSAYAGGESAMVYNCEESEGDMHDGSAFCCENRGRNGGFDTLMFSGVRC